MRLFARLATLLVLATRATTVAPSGVSLQPFGAVSIGTAEIVFTVDGDGRNIDSIAFWEAPNPSDTLMFVTAKANQRVEVWKYPFQSQLATLQHSCLGSNSRVNGVVVDQETDLLYVSVGRSRNVCLFALPQLSFVSSFQAPADLGGEPNLGLLKLSSGQTRVHVTDDVIVYVHDAATGSFLSQFVPSKGLETVVGDSFYQALYIPDENGGTGVYAYDPDGNPYLKDGTNNFGGGGVFNHDGEGILIYSCPSDGSSDNGEGLIVVSDQTSPSGFEFFNRKTWEYLGTVTISGVENTDGIASTQQASPTYPLGVFSAVDDDRSTVGVGWDTILEKTGLSCGSG
jgi:myo-inositol-hexaphosphate 3-phosphohydrolase